MCEAERGSENLGSQGGKRQKLRKCLRLVDRPWGFKTVNKNDRIKESGWGLSSGTDSSAHTRPMSGRAATKKKKRSIKNILGRTTSLDYRGE